MTLPHEEARSLHYAHDFLLDLLDPKKTPKVPLTIRQHARSVLRHYPYSSRIDEAWKVLIEREEKMFAKVRKADKASNSFPKNQGVVVAHDNKQIIVYVEKNTKPFPKFPKKWEGFPVKVVKTDGRVMPF